MTAVNSVKVLKYQILIFRVFGIWPPKTPTIISRLHTFVAFYVLSLGFIGTLSLSIMNVKSVKQVIDNLIISSSVILAFIKGVIIYFNKPKILSLFKILRELDDKVSDNAERKCLNIIYGHSQKMLKLFLGAYMTAWIVLVMQSFWADKEKAFWSSTTLYPHEISQNRIVFWFVLVFQAFANFCLCLVVGAADTYGVILNYLLGGHVDILAIRLQKLGFETEGKEQRTANGQKYSSTSHVDLSQNVKTYILCLE